MPKICYTPKNFGVAAQERIAVCNAIIEDYEAQGFDLTLRQLYYQLVSRDYIANNVREYKNLGVLISDARLAGLVDWERIVDRVRNLRKLPSWDSPAEIISSAAYDFHMSRWQDQETYVEVWIEKNALIGVIEPICDELDIPYFACVGYTSQSEMWGAARRLERQVRQGKTVVILHLGDHDPSGKDMTRDIQDRLSLFVGTDLRKLGVRWGGVEVDRLALNWDQVEQFNPPPNPAKLTDSRATAYIEEFGLESWELDALDPATIAGIIRTAVSKYVNEDKWQEVEEEEETGKTLLNLAVAKWDEVSSFLQDLDLDEDEDA
jgi:hypothetical protein